MDDASAAIATLMDAALTETAAIEDTPLHATATSLPDTPIPATETPLPEVPATPTVTSPPPTPISLLLDSMTISSISIYATFGQGEVPRDLTFSPDGTVLASAGGNTEDFDIRLW